MVRHLFLSSFIGVVVGSSCWRDTKCTGLEEAVFPGPWDDYNYAPSSRTVRPKEFFSLNDASNVTDFGKATTIPLSNDLEALVFDFGLEVGGIITVNYTLAGTAGVSLGIAFTEAKDYIGRKSDNSNGGPGADGSLSYAITEEGPGTYVLPDAKLRGGFRYLSLFLDSNTTASLNVHDISLELVFQPTWPNLRAYHGYFYSNDDLLNRIWYSGAYTLQSNCVPGNTGRHQTNLTGGWQNDEYIGPGDSVLLDGAKRDRWVWIGDMGTAVPSQFVSTGELDSVKNALLAIYAYQKSDGQLPKAGPPHKSTDSTTYHLWVLIGTYNYYLYTGDDSFLEDNWEKYTRALSHTLGTLTEDGIVNITGTADWGRWTYSVKRASASMLLYRALTTCSSILTWYPGLEGDAFTAETCLERSKTLRENILKVFWDNSKGAFMDEPNNRTMYPQDANSMALAFGVVSPGHDDNKADRVSDYLASNLTPIGPSCPELPNNISPFISSIELEGHFKVGRPDRSLALMRSIWGWYLDHPNGTASTTPEGYLLDGTWGYRGDRGYRNDPSYVSHAHGWSSGPTSTLTEYMVGLTITRPLGKTWEFRPATFSELSEAEAGFTTSLGKFSAGFKVAGGRLTVHWDVPEGTEGVVSLPGFPPERMQGGKGTMTKSLW
ncbi:unnamed protein product [Clonostachys rhizophaga]|uniref:Alpha-L-rhamnosidase six-hairpin glycosidase domain-containing protein n=1 Tax=Clonostachys rhizophaga TaxID=160324 RepID=A0A9N9VZ99_9HYPO|nr:unnamed protein product [Clonostachys rhizophaga]